MTMLVGVLVLGGCAPRPVDPFAAAPPLHTFQRLGLMGGQFAPRDFREPGPVLCTDRHVFFSTTNELRIITINSGSDATLAPYVFDPDLANDPSQFLGLFLESGRLIAVSGDEIIIFSLSAPERPAVLGRYDFRSSPDTTYAPISNMALAGRSLFVIFRAGLVGPGLQMRRYDVSGDVPVRAEALRFKSATGVPVVPNTLGGDARWLYVFAAGAMYTLDATIPGNLQPSGVALMPAGRVTVMGKQLLVDQGNLGYGVVDVSDPLTPTSLVSGRDTPYTLDEFIMPGMREDAALRFHTATWQHDTLFFSGYWRDGSTVEGLVTTGVLDRDGKVQGRDAPLSRIMSDPRISHVCWNGQVLTVLGERTEFWGP